MEMFYVYEATTAHGDSAEAKDHTRVSEEEEEEKVWKKNKQISYNFFLSFKNYFKLLNSYVSSHNQLHRY